MSWCCCCFFFFNDTATTEIYTLSLHDALPIFRLVEALGRQCRRRTCLQVAGDLLDEHGGLPDPRDRKSTRLNSSHLVISYAVFCLKKKNIKRFNLSIPLITLEIDPRHVLCLVI